MKSVSKKTLGVSCLLGATLIWGSSFIILKVTLDSVPALWILTLRFSGAAVFMAALGWRKRGALDRTYVYYGLALGVTVALAYILQTFGLQYTTPGKNAFLTATYCVMVPFLCWLIYKKRPDRYNAAAAVICLAGMGLVSLTGELSLGLGDGLTMCCGLFYALQIMIISAAVQTCDPVLLSMLQFAVAAVICGAAAPMASPLPAAIPASAWAAIAYLCVMCTGVCFLLQAVGQKYTPPEPTAIILTLESVFGTALSMLFGDEALTPRVALGFVLIFASVIVSETKLDFLKKKEVVEPDAAE